MKKKIQKELKKWPKHKIINKLKEIQKIDPERFKRIKQELISMYN